MLTDIYEAKALVEKERSVKIAKGLDYGDCYVFVVGTNGSQWSRTVQPLSIDKETQKISGFNPLVNDPELYFYSMERNAIDFT